jgi:hypothetical protein
MMQKWLTASVSVALLAAAGAAHAQGRGPDFGAQGQLAISGERLFGINYARASNTTDGQPSSYHSATVIGFGWNSDPASSSFVHPRVGIDYFVIDRLSLGGAVGLYTASGHDPQTDGTGLLLAPRVGYAIDLGRVASFWPRGGITYYSHTDYHNVALSGEANFALFPRSNWAFLVTPFFDMGPFGAGPNGYSYSELALGLSLGIMGVI